MTANNYLVHWNWNILYLMVAKELNKTNSTMKKQLVDRKCIIKLHDDHCLFSRNVSEMIVA